MSGPGLHMGWTLPVTNTCEKTLIFGALWCRKGGGRWRGREGDERDPVRTAEREERERRRAEARRYPIDDTELLAELREKAYAEGKQPAQYTISLAESGGSSTTAVLRGPRHNADSEACLLACRFLGRQRCLSPACCMH